MKRLKNILLVLQIITIAIPLLRLLASVLADYYDVADDASNQEQGRPL